MLVQCLRTTMNATAPRPINAINAPYPGDLVGVGVGVGVGMGVATVVGTTVVGTGVGTAVGAAPSRTLNNADPVTPWITASCVHAAVTLGDFHGTGGTAELAALALLSRLER
jgi:hypothetical protein